MSKHLAGAVAMLLVAAAAAPAQDTYRVDVSGGRAQVWTANGRPPSAHVIPSNGGSFQVNLQRTGAAYSVVIVRAESKDDPGRPAGAFTLQGDGGSMRVTGPVPAGGATVYRVNLLTRDGRTTGTVEDSDPRGAAPFLILPLPSEGDAFQGTVTVTADAGGARITIESRPTAPPPDHPPYPADAGPAGGPAAPWTVPMLSLSAFSAYYDFAHPKLEDAWGYGAQADLVLQSSPLYCTGLYVQWQCIGETKFQEIDHIVCPPDPGPGPGGGDDAIIIIPDPGDPDLISCLEIRREQVDLCMLDAGLRFQYRFSPVFTLSFQGGVGVVYGDVRGSPMSCHGSVRGVFTIWGGACAFAGYSFQGTAARTKVLDEPIGWIQSFLTGVEFRW